MELSLRGGALRSDLFHIACTANALKLERLIIIQHSSTVELWKCWKLRSHGGPNKILVAESTEFMWNCQWM